MTDVKETRKKSINLNNFINQPYKYGFHTDIESHSFPKGLTEKTVKLISHYKKEPKYLIDFRIRGYKKWKKMHEPNWSQLKYPSINYNNIVYYSIPKYKKKKKKVK